MKKANFDLDMIDEYPDSLGSRPDKQQEPVPMKKTEEKREVEGVRYYDSIPFSDFAKIDMRVGKIVEVSEVPNAKGPLVKLRVDLGDVGTRTIVAGIKEFYSMDELENRLIIVVVNLKPRSLAGIMSEGMLLAAENDNGDVSLLAPDKNVEPGCRIR
jgi:methionyl-tRNA synthetase